MSVLKTSMRNFVAHKGRMVLSGMAVMLSVAFVCGTLVFTSTMQATFDRLFAEDASSVMIGPEGADQAFDEPSVTGRPDTVPAGVTEEVAGIDGVERATGSVTSDSVVAVDGAGESVGPTTGAPTIVTNWSDLALRTMELDEGSPPGGPGEILVDAQTAQDKDVAIGDALLLQTVSGPHEVTVSGIASFQITNPGAALLFLETATAQDVLLGGADAYTQIYVDGDGSVPDTELKERVVAAVGDGGYTIQTAEEYIEANEDALGQFFSIMRWVLLGFAAIALLVGVFLIVNTFTMLVAQRTREIGLFRAIGAERGQVNRSVMFEALLLGVVGSLLGLAAGIGIALALMALMSAIGITLSTSDLTIGAEVPVVGLAVGIVITLVAAYIPARRAGRITPMAALQEAGLPGDLRAGRVRAAVGAALTVLGLAALVAITGADDSAAGGQLLALGIVLTLVGMVLFAPALVGLVLRGLSAVLLRGFGSIGRLAERNALRNPRRSGATASALMIGLALVAGLSVVASSMVASAGQEIDETVGADYILQSENFTVIYPEAVAAVRAADDVASVTELRGMDGELTFPDGAEVGQNFVLVDLTYPDVIDAAVVEGDLAGALEDGELALDEDRARAHDLSVGDELTMELDNGSATTVRLGAVLEASTAGEGSTAMLSIPAAEEQLPADAVPLPFILFASAEEGRLDEARASLEEALQAQPTVQVRDQAEYKELIEDQVGQALNLVYGLLALAIIVAVLGVVNTLALSVVERTREIGLMRAIGLSRVQLRRMIRLEAVVIALFGAVLGVALGLAWGWATAELLALEGFEVFEVPWDVIVIVFLGSALVGLLAALIPAFRAGRMNVLTAIATE